MKKGQQNTNTSYVHIQTHTRNRFHANGGEENWKETQKNEKYWKDCAVWRTVNAIDAENTQRWFWYIKLHFYMSVS